LNRRCSILILTIISLGAIVTTIPETSAHPWIEHSPEKVVLAAPGEVVEFEINTIDVWGVGLKGIEITLEYSGTFLYNRARLKEDFPVSLSIYKGHPPFKSVVSVTVPSSTPPGEMYDVQILATATYEDEARGRITLGTPSVEYLVFDVGGPAEQVVSIKTDATSYEQGEAVSVTGEVLYNTKPTPPAGNLVAIEVKVPGSGLRRLFSVKTDNYGRFGPVLPFTGHKIGKYTLTAECSLKTESGENVLAKSEYSFEVKKAIIDEDAIPNQLRKLTELFKKSIPEGPVRTSGLGKRLGVPDSLYGSIHNLFLYKTKTDPTGDFACRGYQEQTLVFMDSIRFNKDPEVRKLLKGLDYGPVCRGMVIINAHHSVVVYPIGTDWKSNEGPPALWPKVFDPWPEQRPKVYTVPEFCGGAGFPRIDNGYYYVDEARPWSCYPLTGGEVYANFEVVKAARPQYLRSSTETLLSTKFSAAIRCPVDVLLTDSQGKRLGMLSNGSFVWEFPAFIYRASEGNRTLGWYFELPDGIYNTTVTGQSTGTFDLLIKDDAEAGRYFDYGNQSITTDAQAKITIGMGRTEPLTLPNGEKILPKTVTIPDLEVPSPTTSQSFTTITSWTTVTDVVTSTQLSTMVVSTTVVTSTATNTLLRDTEKPFTVKAATPGGCQFLPVTYNAVAGQRLVGYVTSDKGLNFYLMSKDQFIRYEEAGCGQKVDAHLFIAETTSYTLDWVVPQDGTYYFIFENYGSARNQDVKGTFALYDISLQTTTSTVYSTFSTEIEYTTTRSFSSVYSTPISQPFPIGDNQMGVIALLLLAVPLGLVFAALRRRASKMPRASETPPVDVPPAPMQFCENCGRQISAGTLYCQSCGDKQGV